MRLFMRVVLDTNVVISGLLWKGVPSDILALAQEGRITVCVSADNIVELKETLSRPKFRKALTVTKRSAGEVVNGFLEFAEEHPVARFPSVQIHADPSDDVFLACAITAGASYIISGDKHLLKLQRFRGVDILSASAFLRRFRRKGQRESA
ncbi:MAG: putative toxin-antitoxin system toxin component, PIN family [Patescibacteria group bacterium]